jgi:cytochrome b pre-mRNA-processing protein 3
MLAWLNRHHTRRRTARSLYGSIVTAARQQFLYSDWGVPDTMQGRFEMIVLHLVLVLRRLAAEDEPDSRLARMLSEAFVVDMDDAMRELTFGDLAVPREIKRATAALYDRHRTYLAALAAGGDTPLQDALTASMAYAGAGAALDAHSLSRYVREAAGLLGAQPAERILAGQLAWPGPPGGTSRSTP